MSASPFSSYRVLDLTDEKGLICGKILADLGAEVIKVEKPGGDPARRLGPFYQDNPDPEKSLFWWAFNTGKRSITLDFESPGGKAILLDLVKRADFLIESFPPGHMVRSGLDYPRLREINDRLIYISISGFGQTGPYRDFKAPDIVVMALSGVMNLVGDPGRTPLCIGVPQAYLHAGTEAAVAGLMALWHREASGRGQYIDVSAQECVTWEGFYNQASWNLNKANVRRLGSWRELGGKSYPYVFPCKDGYICFTLLGGAIGARGQWPLVAWMDGEGMADDFLRSFDWEAFEPAKGTMEEYERLNVYFSRFFLTKTKQELLDRAVRDGLFLAPSNTAKDIVASPHLKSRGYWAKMEHEEPGIELLYPGHAYISRECPYQVSKRAPHIGEHNREVYIDELGMTEQRLRALREAQIV